MAGMVIMPVIIMDIDKFSVRPKEKNVSNELTFESEEEISKKNRCVKFNNEIIGEFVFNNDAWEWKQAYFNIGVISAHASISMEIMIKITEKLKDLNDRRS